MKSKNGTDARRGGGLRTTDDDRFGAGSSREGERIATALGAGTSSRGASGYDEDAAGPTRPSPEEIAERAYEHYLARQGTGEGSAEADWLAAEEELRRERGR